MVPVDSLNDTMADPWDTGCIYQGRVMMFPTGLTRMYDPASVICSTVSNATRAGVVSGWLWCENGLISRIRVR